MDVIVAIAVNGKIKVDEPGDPDRQRERWDGSQNAMDVFSTQVVHCGGSWYRFPILMVGKCGNAALLG